MNLIITVTLVRNLVSLLHSNGTEKSNNKIKPAFCFRTAPNNYKGYNNMSSVVFHYMTDFFYDE